MPNSTNDDESLNKNAPYRTSRRAAHRGSLKRARRGRRIIVHSELREEPDVRKIARAIISMAMAEAEREAQAEAEAKRDGQQSPESADD